VIVFYAFFSRGRTDEQIFYTFSMEKKKGFRLSPKNISQPPAEIRAKIRSAK
jgi:hypothetical protein